MSTTATKLYQWMTEDMSILPLKRSKKGRVPFTAANLEFLVEGAGEKLWLHVVKHVHSHEKVDKIRKNILLNRIKKCRKGEEFQKNDHVGKLFNELLEVKYLRSAINEKMQAILKLENECKQVNHKLKVAECKRQFLQNKSEDIERRISLLEMVEETVEAKIRICQSSERFFERFKSNATVDLDSTSHPAFAQSINESRNWLICPYETENNDNALSSSKAHCLRFLDKCALVAKEMIDDKFSHQSHELTSKDVLWERMSLQDCSIFSSVHRNNSEFPVPKFESKKKELRKYISDNMHQLPPQTLYNLLLMQTCRGIAELAKCDLDTHSEDKFRILGYRKDHKELEAMMDERFNNLNFEITHNFIAAARERRIASKARQTLKSHMAQVEAQLKEIFNVQAAMVEKAYKLVECEAQAAFLRGATSHKEIFIHGKESKLSSRSSRIIEKLIMPNEVKLKESLKHLIHFRKSIQYAAVKNHSKFMMCVEDMRSPVFLRELQSYGITRGLINQEIMAFNEYPLEYHNKTTVFGKVIPDFKLLLNGSSWQNLVCMGVIGNDDAELDSCIQATVGLIPYSSSEAILNAVIQPRFLIDREVVAIQDYPKSLEDDKILQFHLPRTQELSEVFQRKEESWKIKIATAKKETEKCNAETKDILDEADFILRNWCESVINNYVPESIVYEGKNYQQWLREVATALSCKEKL